jgi:hypothetical protein|tara:strand:+ start:264 stop:500 length:237 start_codon:yes stop_codon:yes gene_type:complete
LSDKKELGNEFFRSNNMQRYLSKNELKDYLGVSLGTINNKLKELPHIKWGDNRNARVLFPVVEIEKYFGNISDKVKRS